MKQFLTGLRILAYPGCLLLGLVFTPVYGFVSATFLSGESMQTLYSPDGTHRATLLRKYNLADFNFIVKIDGQRVYESPDLIPFSDRSYRETLVWDKNSKIVVLELMGKKVFAYDVANKRRLGKGELQQYRLYPLPTDNVYVVLKDIDE